MHIGIFAKKQNVFLWITIREKVNFLKQIYPAIRMLIIVIMCYGSDWQYLQQSSLVCVLGVPYAEPPVGSFRFSPPRSPQPWRGVRQSQEFAPVCPQVLPNLREEVKPGRYEYLERHLPYLKNQSEDCLYLNIYAPHQADGKYEWSYVSRIPFWQ